MKGVRLSWLMTGLAIVATAIAFSLALFGVPDRVRARLAQVTGITNLLPATLGGSARVQSSRWPQAMSVLPSEVRTPLPEASGIARLRSLRERPALLIETATLVAAAGETIRIATPTLTLRDAAIVTNGATLDIETDTLDATNSTIRAFAEGMSGARAAGAVRITVRGAMRGVLTVDLAGTAGVAGGSGVPGLPGRAGVKGERAKSGPTTCLVPAGRGGDGAAGAAGAAGREGGAGSAGGTMTVVAADPIGITGQIQFSAPGGAGGAGGAGGPGGPGGAAGPGGDPAGVCFGTGSPGAPGERGAAGAQGANGPAGAEGDIRIEALGS